MEISNSTVYDDWDPELAEGGLGHQVTSDEEDNEPMDGSREHYVSVG